MSPSSTECNGIGNSLPTGSFAEPWGLTLDSSDNLWIADTGAHRVDKFDSAGNFLAQGEGGHWGESGYDRGVAYSNATGHVYLSDSNHDDIWVLDSTTVGFIAQLPKSESASDPDGWGSGCCYVYTAADNSGGPTDGSIYVASNNQGSVFRVDGEGNPVNFAAANPYISGNRLFGAPTGPGGEVEAFGGGEGAQVAIDSSGRIIVGDVGRRVVDVFDSTGTFEFEIKETPGGPFGSVVGLGVDPTSDDILVVDSEHHTVEEFDSTGQYSTTIDGSDSPTGSFSGNLKDVAVDSGGRVYISDAGNGVIQEYGADVVLPKVNYGEPTNPGQTSATVNATIDPNGGGPVLECKLEYGTNATYGSNLPCNPDPASSPPGSNFSTPTAVSVALSGLTTEATYHYRFVVSNANGIRKGSDKTLIPHAVVGLATDPATGVGPTSAALNGSWTGNGEETHYLFEWGLTAAYGNKTASPPGISGGDAPEPTTVSAVISELKPITIYHFRIVATNNAGTSYGADRFFTTPPNAPQVTRWVTTVHSDSAVLHASINPGGGATKYHFEWGTTDCASSACQSAPVPDAQLASNLKTQEVSQLITGLTAGTVYHYRVVAVNALDTTESPDRTFTTFPYTSLLTDTCPNAHARQQTGAALLLDCRAYEIVSAAEVGGYDVESTLVSGQTPFGGYPRASVPSRVLYGLHFGALPGVGAPTNFGLDPYVATRGDSGWTTRYVGIPANGTPSPEPFSSTLGEADSRLTTFAFAGNICSPCFANGTSAIPIHLPDGSLVQGMSGSLDPGPAIQPDGYVAQRFSADGSHFVFGSTSKFEPDGNSNGDVSIYDRDLQTGVTRVVSKSPGGANLACLGGAGTCHSPGDGRGIGELGISQDGGRVLVAQRVSTDAEGNDYWHPYMYIESLGHSVDLVPPTTTGVLFGGMTDDGSTVVFTTADKLLGSDTDSSADIYAADVDSDGDVTLRLLSTGTAGAGDTDTCDPDLNADRAHWNTVGAGLNCSAVAIAGGGGLAAGDGSVYFLSPEKLDGTAGAQDKPNLYLVRPGSAPHFVATLELDSPIVRNALKDAGKAESADFEVNESGDDAAFPSTLSLTGYSNNAHSEVYRYDAPGDRLDCASCPPTGAQASGDAGLPANGLGLTSDGRVFFTSTDPLAPSDNNGHADAYEWKAGQIGLISTGIGFFDARLLSVSADGTDAYFFTRDTLAPQDHNGTSVKIYDAREKGGFPFDPPPEPCKASDECHGPGSQAAGPPNIGTYKGSGGNEEHPARTKKHRRRHHHRKHHHRHHSRRHHA